MIFELKCKRCGSILIYNSENKGDEYLKCENCEATMSMRTETKIDGILSIDDFEVVGIKRQFPSSVLETDLLRLKEIYENSSGDTQEKILTTIDLFYLLLERKDEKLLDETLDRMHTLFHTIVEEQNIAYLDKLNGSKK